LIKTRKPPPNCSSWANFDLVSGREIKAIAAKAGVKALHANELGVGKIEYIAADVLRVIKKSDARFFLSRLEKRYLAPAKVFDTYFDAGENWPWRGGGTGSSHCASRLFLSLQLTKRLRKPSVIFSRPQARVSHVQPSCGLPSPCSPMCPSNVPDARSRQILTDGFQWALENPEAFSSYTRVDLVLRRRPFDRRRGRLAAGLLAGRSGLASRAASLASRSARSRS
jgi:hypothetical protein